MTEEPVAQELRGKRIIITGGAKGMAAALVRDFIRHGAAVVSLDVDEADGLAVAKTANDEGGGHVDFIACDVASEPAVIEAFAEAVSRLGGLDGLVHAAGIAPGAAAEKIDLSAWESVFAVNARGTFLTNRAAFEHMKAHGGRIVNFASAAGATGLPGKAHYAASKGACARRSKTRPLERRRDAAAGGVKPGQW